MCLRKSLFFNCFFLFSCEIKKQDTSDVLARVGDEILTFKKATALNGGSVLMKEKLPRLVQDWVTNTVLLKKAKSLGIDQDSSIIKKRDVYFNDLIISSFINHSFKPNIEISKKEVLDYYNNNKEDFSRGSDEIFLEHYFTEDIGVSKKLSSFFNSNKKARGTIAKKPTKNLTALNVNGPMLSIPVSCAIKVVPQINVHNNAQNSETVFDIIFLDS